MPGYCSWASWGELPYEFQTNGYFYKNPNTDFPQSLANYIDHTHEVAANGYVHKMSFYWDSFYLEPNHDWAYLGRGGPYNQVQYNLTGYRSPGWTVVDLRKHFVSRLPPYQDFWERYPARFRVTTDSSTNLSSHTFEVSKVRVCYDPNVGYMNNDHWLDTPDRVDGVLLNDGDVVYFMLTNAPAQADTGFNFIINADNSAADFDVYVYCDARPQENLWDYRGYHPGSSEFIHIPPQANYCQNKTIYVAVHSWSGNGRFYLKASRIKAEHIHTLTAGSEPSFYAGSGDCYSALYHGTRKLYWVTEGQVMIDRIDFYPGQGCNNCGGSECNICFTDDPPPPACDCPVGGCGGCCLDIGWGGGTEPCRNL